MEACITPLPEVKSVSEVAGGQLEPFPQRLNAVPPRIAGGLVPGFSAQTYQEDNKLWQKHVNAYKKTNDLLDTGRYRNIMDMNAGLGSFAAVLESPKLWIMNVVPTIADTSTLGVIYERGLIGMYHDWYVILPYCSPGSMFWSSISFSLMFIVQLSCILVFLLFATDLFCWFTMWRTFFSCYVVHLLKKYGKKKLDSCLRSSFYFRIFLLIIVYSFLLKV